MSSGGDDALRAAIAWASRELGLHAPSVAALTGGLSNRSFRLRDDHHDLVLRIGGGADVTYRISRDSEHAALSAAARFGLAPGPVIADTARGWLVTRFARGEPWTRDQARDPANVRRIAAWMARLHAVALPDGVKRVNLAESVAAYAREPALAASDLRLGRLLAAATDRAEEAVTDDPPVLCHHDLHHLNIIEAADRLCVIDWEYAGQGAALADLAAYVRYHDLDHGGARSLLAAYAPGRQGALSTALEATCWLFDCVWLLWMEIQQASGAPADAALAQRRQELRGRLGV